VIFRLFFISIILLFPCFHCPASEWSKSKVLESHTTITVKSEDKLNVRQEQRIIIAAEKDKKEGYDGCYQTKFQKLRRLEAAIYDSTGESIRKLKKDDIEETSLFPPGVHREGNVRYHQLSYPVLPYLISKVMEYECFSTFYWPDWYPQEDIVVVKAQLEIILEIPFAFNYKNIGRIADPEITTDSEGNKHYCWLVENIPAFKREHLYAPEAGFQTGVQFMPQYFDLDGFQGSNESWKTFGNWYYSLIKDRSEFSDEIKDFEPFRLISDQRERIRAVYRYLQQKTRYVSIDLGLEGGYQPFNVNDTYQVQYGDCNDLSNYMVAILAKAGIRAYPALVMTRNRGWVDLDFPGHQFNHCIAVVPLQGDTLWLECTSDVARYNDPPAWIEGVHVLLIKPDSSEIIRTPLSPAAANQSLFSGKAMLHTNQSVKLEGKVIYTGNQAHDLRYYLKDLSSEKRKEWLIKKISRRAGEVRVNSFIINGLQNPDTVLIIDFSLNLPYYAKSTGSRLIIEPRLFHQIDFEGEEPEKRIMPLYNMTRFTDHDSIQFIIPFNYALKSRTETDTVATEFGEYRYKCLPTDTGFIWTSTFILDSREIPLEAYPAYYHFMNHIKKLSQKKLVLEKKMGF
jgi:hypothetical protein